jgi:nitrilase
MASQRLKVAAAQVTPVYLRRDESIEKACQFIERAAREGVRLVVFPEVFVPGYPDWVWVVPNTAPILNDLYRRLLDNAVTVTSEATAKLCAAAKRNKIYVIIGVHERNSEASDASLYNSLLFIDDQGEIVDRHRKLMPTGAERLLWALGDGSMYDVLETPFGRIGGLICWENYMPLARQALYDSGVQILATPTWDKSENWVASLRYIAREGGAFVVNCCTALRMDDVPDEYGFKQFYPSEREWINVGNSCVINPKGEVIAGPLEGKEDLVIAEVDLGEIASAKRMFDVAGHYARRDVFDFSVRRPSPPRTDRKK